eukprot:6954-Heterococcus_DN1.PRE.1
MNIDLRILKRSAYRTLHCTAVVSGQRVLRAVRVAPPQAAHTSSTLTVLLCAHTVCLYAHVCTACRSLATSCLAQTTRSASCATSKASSTLAGRPAETRSRNCEQSSLQEDPTAMPAVMPMVEEA